MEKTWKVRDLSIAEMWWFEKWLGMPLGPEQEVTLKIGGEFPPIPPLPTEEENEAFFRMLKAMGGGEEDVQ